MGEIEARNEQRAREWLDRLRYQKAARGITDGQSLAALLAEVEADAADRIETLVVALRNIRGFDDPLAHRGHEPAETGHECRMCWIMRTCADALREAKGGGT